MRNCTHNVSRLFIDGDLSRNVVDIGHREAHYLGHVLRLKRGDRVVCQPGATTELAALERDAGSVSVLVGPEGGFSPTDLDTIDAAGFARIGLGPRVLRADTAAIAACTLAQSIWGDFN